MGRLKNGINGAFSGKIGTVVGASCRGIDYVRSAGRKRKIPATAPQQMQRDKFALVMGWLKPLIDVINVGYQVVTGNKTPMNLAVSYHLKEAVTGITPDLTIDFKKAVFSKGELLISWVLEVLVLIDHIIHIKWENLPAYAFSNDSDKATFIVYNPGKGQFVTFENAAVRSAKEALLEMPADIGGDIVHCWMCYASADGSKVSTSIYIGEVYM